MIEIGSIIMKAMRMGKNFRDTLNERLSDAAFQKEWAAIKAEQQSAVYVDHEHKDNMNHEKVASLLGVIPADITLEEAMAERLDTLANE